MSNTQSSMSEPHQQQQRRIIILISGGGSNMAAIVKAAQRDHWQQRLRAQVTAVIANKSDASGLSFAQAQGIHTAVLPHTAFDSREAFDQALVQTIDELDPPTPGYAPALVVLAGFMRILTPAFVAHYQGRLLNIHPSLLPAFAGLHTHQRALDMGCKFAGATVHQVTAELDHGAFLAQAAVPVLPTDTASTLAARVLTQEHLIYPQAIAQWLQANA
ncbi:phosphoribosylglycinamide formyltransferase [Comamonadaceae bacterium M7527]|nr:phosphoribosylglycinamide formyltransferase [Comamonadaceae bacterium M7527]